LKTQAESLPRRKSTVIPWTRVLWIGFLSWLIPFVAGFAAFPVKRINAPLFSSIMYLVVLVTAGVLLRLYFRNRDVTVQEAGLVGAVWMAINLILDYPMFAFGPMKMTPLDYYSEIGIVYLTFPVFAILAARLCLSTGKRKESEVKR
jgi:uncharacterized membrane protein YpjA